tara:strand:- start:1035 stop:3149 length:2115 start_codon:yes stop_codon:yes gene_type:complete
MSVKPLGSHEKYLIAAERAGRQLIHSWIIYGPKELNHFDPDSFPSGALQHVAGGVLTAMLQDGVKDFSGLVVWFDNAPDGIKWELIECAQEVAPMPTDCEPCIIKLHEYHRALQLEIVSDKLKTALANGNDTKQLIKELARIEKSKPVFNVPDSQPSSDDHEPSDIFDHASDYPTQSNRIHDLPFRLLGAANGVHRYLPDNGMTVIALNAPSHTQLNLIQLAPLQAWETVFPAKDGCKWAAAANALIQSSLSLPQYDPRNIRGRGCWIDGNDVIYHAGSKLSVNGRITPIHAYDSPNLSIYEAGLPIKLDTEDASRNIDSSRVIELCESLSWDQPLFGKLLAGWMALAPISGAMSWRPHIWVTGASGSGKSWIMSNIIHQVAGPTALFVQGNTSEAGIRGRLGSDSLPVLFDEAESENHRSGNRMEGVIELARQASSEGGGGIIKGTQTGGSITYMIRSMFCFSSIGVAAVKKADTSRISVLNLKKTDDPAQFERVKAIWRETVANADFCERFRARSIRNALIIRRNSEVFSSAAVAFTGDKRSADQIGTLLAGAFSLVSTKEITLDAATAWLGGQEWTEYKVEPIDSDENQCLAHLFAAHIRLETSKGIETITIDEAIDRARLQIVPDMESLALMRNGIKVDGDTFYVANRHSGLERVFRDTPWSGGKWKGQLTRVAGAIVAKNPVRFGPMMKARAVLIPWVE